MKIVNTLGLSKPLEQAILKFQEDYELDSDASDTTVTTLVGPPRIAELGRRKSDEITVEAMDLLWALQGTAMHLVLEQAEPSEVTEERLFSHDLGWVWSGKFDRLHVSDGLLQDYKWASVYEVIAGVRPEREQQLNLLAELATRHGYDVRGLQVIMLLRDWSASKAQTEPWWSNYPRQQEHVENVTLWSKEERMAFLYERLKEHQAARNAKTLKHLPLCSPEDRWEGGDVYAVRATNRQKALSGGLKDSEDEAQAMIDEIEADPKQAKKYKGLYIEHRPGLPVRCMRYCRVSQVCSQWANDPRHPDNVVQEAQEPFEHQIDTEPRPLFES